MATVEHFPTNSSLIFLTVELTNDKFLVDTGATLSIVPHTSNSKPSGPLTYRLSTPPHAAGA
jgi:hypothetical protein